MERNASTDVFNGYECFMGLPIYADIPSLFPSTTHLACQFLVCRQNVQGLCLVCPQARWTLGHQVIVDRWFSCIFCNFIYKLHVCWARHDISQNVQLVNLWPNGSARPSNSGPPFRFNSKLTAPTLHLSNLQYM